MRIIDINCMLGPWSEKIPFLSSDELIKALECYRMESCIAFSSLGIINPSEGNRLISEACAASNDRIRSCYILDPLLDELNVEGIGSLYERLKAARPSAVRMLPNKNGFLLNDFYCGKLLEVLDTLHLPVLLDYDQTPDYSDLPALARAFCNIPFVLLRQSFKHARYLLPLIEKLGNVYVDTGVMVDTGLIEKIVNRYGSEKLLFGSGMPYYQPAGGIAIVLYAEIDDFDKANIFALNWERLERGILYGN